MPPTFVAEEFGDFVETIDAELLMAAPDLMRDFREALSNVNSPQGIQADDSFAFRLLEYGRQRASALAKGGVLDSLTEEREPQSEREKVIRAAFELGVAVAEHRIMEEFEDYFHAGLALEEWRQEGLPKARAERLRQGRRTRTAIQKAAQALYAEDPNLVRNDIETARRILKLKIPELHKSNGAQIGLDAITRHLREARRCEHK